MPVPQITLKVPGSPANLPYASPVTALNWQVDYITATLGAAPEGAYSTVSDRLDALALEKDAAPALVAASGSAQGAGALSAGINVVTSANGTKVVTLPTAVAGYTVVVINTVTNQNLPVYPASGAKVNALSTDAAITLPAATLAVFYAYSATQWYSNIYYMKPATGIPSSDMATAVQTSLGKADSALQTAATHQANSTASDIAGVVADLNTLLGKLQTAGLMG